MCIHITYIGWNLEIIWLSRKAHTKTHSHESRLECVIAPFGAAIIATNRFHTIENTHIYYFDGVRTQTKNTTN